MTSALLCGPQSLAVVQNATLDLHAPTPALRWTRLAAPAAAGNSVLTLAGTGLGWPVGADMVVTSSDFNHLHAEYLRITSVSEDGNTTLVGLNASLAWRHEATVTRWAR